MQVPAKGPANPPSQNNCPSSHSLADSPEEIIALSRLMARVPAPPQPFPVRRVEPVDLRLADHPLMYPLEINKDGTTRHSKDCRRTPSRYDWNCHRCCELLQGAKPRTWSTDYLRRKIQGAQRSLIFGPDVPRRA